jgi:hypothetical protein
VIEAILTSGTLIIPEDRQVNSDAKYDKQEALAAARETQAQVSEKAASGLGLWLAANGDFVMHPLSFVLGVYVSLVASVRPWSPSAFVGVPYSGLFIVALVVEFTLFFFHHKADREIVAELKLLRKMVTEYEDELKYCNEDYMKGKLRKAKYDKMISDGGFELYEPAGELFKSFGVGNG